MAKKTRKPAHRVHHAPRQASGIDRNFENFVEEIAEHRSRISAHKCNAKEWWHGSFGPIGPLLGAVVGMVCVAVIAWAITIVNIGVSSGFLSMASSFLFANLSVFLLIFLVANYLKHAYMSHERLYYIVKPVKVAFELAVGFWLLSWAMQFAGMQTGNVQLMGGSQQIMASLGGLFVTFLVIGYAAAMVKREREIYAKK